MTSPRHIQLAAVALLVVSMIAALLRSMPAPSATIATDIPAPRHTPSASPPASPIPPPTPTITEQPTTIDEPAAEPDQVSAPQGDLVVPDTEPAAAADTQQATHAPPPPPAPTAPTDSSMTAERQRFEQAFPAHAAASEDLTEPDTTRWALLIGVNNHSGRTRDNLTSAQDATKLGSYLRGIGWRSDHVLELTDLVATRENIIEAIHWLARSTTADSVVVVHYSGHTKQWPGEDRDNDGETTDEAMWPSDNRHITDGELASLFGTVPAGRMWINISACEAAGYVDPGLARDGRIITFSSAEDEKSYEDPSVDHSVWGYNIIERAFVQGLADSDRDGVVTVEEAVTYAVPRATERTRNQAPGPQHGGVLDHASGAFNLLIPPPPPEPEPEPEPTPTPSPSETDDGPCLLLCNRAPAVADHPRR